MDNFKVSNFLYFLVVTDESIFTADGSINVTAIKNRFRRAKERTRAAKEKQKRQLELWNIFLKFLVLIFLLRFFI